jgi:hypothetical protein
MRLVVAARMRGDIWADLGPADRVRVPYEFNARIAELESAGLWVFGGTERRAFTFNATMGSEVTRLNTATVMIAKPTNPAIIRLQDDDAALPVALA